MMSRLSQGFILYILVGIAIAIGSLNFAEASTKSEDLINLNLARKFYEKNELDKAIDYYDKVSKASDYWVESIEEKAWAYTRKNEFEKAIGTLKSVLNPVFAPYVGPETYVLSAFIDLKMCDYKSAFDKITKFKSEMLPRVQALESITTSPDSEFVNTWVKKLAKGDITTGDQLGKDLTKLPRYIQRDTKEITNERMKFLAKKDLEEISKNLKKMKVIEIEVAQRSFTFEKTKQAKLKFDKRKSANILVFPDEQNSEVWLDEIGKYEVKANKCPGGKS
jgi:tetratricopeptide (TPR) repeat protein